MKKLVRGIHEFQKNIYMNDEEFFQKLAQGQKPDALFITCSDSRLDPNQLTQTKPGELFILRNAGNIIPPYSQSIGGEAATIEFALVALGIKDIIVCGHSHCGAVKGLMNPESLEPLPAVKKWLENAAHTHRLVKEAYPELQGDDCVNVAIQENVLCQIENLRTHPAVAAKLAKGELNIHAWVHQFESGKVFAYNPDTEQFDLLDYNYRPLPHWRRRTNSELGLV